MMTIKYLAVLLLVVTADGSSGGCKDVFGAAQCAQLMANAPGICRRNSGRMQDICAYSCDLCDEEGPDAISSCTDALGAEVCASLQNQGLCKSHVAVMEVRCANTCSLCDEEEPEAIIVAVDGGWSDYGDWTECSADCDGGIQSRLRACNNPLPANGGKNCVGDSTDLQACNIHPCPVVVPCEDGNGYCPAWAERGNCHKRYLIDNCKKSCDLCDQ